METLTRSPHDATREAAPTQEHVLLEGPHSRRKELWLVLRAVRDFIAGFRVLHFVGPCVTVFGSARYRSRIRTTPSPVTSAPHWRVSDSR
jgi:hypothetical protein